MNAQKLIAERDVSKQMSDAVMQIIERTKRIAELNVSAGRKELVSDLTEDEKVALLIGAGVYLEPKTVDGKQVMTSTHPVGFLKRDGRWQVFVRVS